MNKVPLYAWAPIYAVLGVILCFIPSVRESLIVGCLVLGGLIVLFGYLANAQSGTDKREIGDNCYLLGFLYTLSIVIATLQGVENAENLQEITGELINAIGIAMATSVIGMLIRIVLIESHVEPHDLMIQQIKQTAAELNDLAATFAETKQASELYRRDLLLVAAATETYREGLEAESLQLSHLLNSHTKQVADALAKQIASSLNATELDEARTVMSEAARQVAPVCTAISKNLLELGNTVEAIRVKFSGSYSAEVGNRIEGISSNLAKLEDAFGKLSSVTSVAIDRLQKTSSDLVAQTEQQLHQIKQQLTEDVKAITQLKQQYHSGQQQIAAQTAGDAANLSQALAEGDSLTNTAGKNSAIALRLKELANDLEQLGDKKAPVTPK